MMENEKIKGVLTALNMIEVKGKQNLDLLYSCIVALEMMQKEGNDGD